MYKLFSALHGTNLFLFLQCIGTQKYAVILSPLSCVPFSFSLVLGNSLTHILFLGQT